jgi:hypothetical protein
LERRNMPRLSRLARGDKRRHGPRMLRNGWAVALFALAMALGGCGGRERSDAATGIARFLAAVQSGDRRAFEAAIDRAAVRADLRGQLIAVARANGVEVDGGPSDFALDRMVAPEVFRLVEAGSGRPLAAPPSPGQVGPLTTLKDGGHACLGEPGGEPCLLSFAKGKAKDDWRLVGMLATDLVIHFGPEPAKK